MQTLQEIIEYKRDEQGRFLTGAKPGPGRPKGSRPKLAESFLSDVYDLWQRKGPAALEATCDENPGLFVKVVASLIPAQLAVTVTETWDTLPVSELEALVANEVRRLGLAAQVIEQTTEADTPSQGEP